MEYPKIDLTWDIAKPMSLRILKLSLYVSFEVVLITLSSN